MIYVFLGPSLPLDQARCLLDATWLPPVARGDVYALVSQQPRAIAIIDGFFERVPAVLHSEILYAMSAGIPVFGSSSMGALRAAELAPYGMRGVGEVYRMFLSGDLTDDDEVAVAHAPAEYDYRPLSDAMVSLRVGLRRAQEAGVITERTATELIGRAQAMFYADRCWSTVLDSGPDALRDYIHTTRPDAKREDALELLACLRQPFPAQPTGPFAPAHHWKRMVQTDGAARLALLQQRLANMPDAESQLAAERL